MSRDSQSAFARAPTISGAPSADPPARRYRAFISYSHADAKWASWLIRRLEGYRVPERFHGRTAPIGEIDARLAPIFRDRDELPTADDLGDAVRGALERSATFIVICSPAAARSRWVNEEVMVFKRLGRGDRIFALIVSGEPNAKNADDECFPPALRFELGSDGELATRPVELIAADAREHADGKEDAFIRLVAGLLGVGFDDLRQRELQRRHRRMMWITVGATVGMAITLGLAAVAWVKNNDARRRLEGQEQLMTRMLDGLDARLKKADRLDELDGEIKGTMAFFQSLDPRDLTDAMLAKQAKALTQLGEVRAKQLRYAEADAAFSTALERLAVLTQRHPRDGGMLFERAQAEWWIGNMHYKRGDLGLTGQWWQRYRDSGVELAGLDPKNLVWQREAISGLHNLAALDFERGDLSAARRGFERELSTVEKLAAQRPEERSAEFSRTNIVSYLGSVAERVGNFSEALERFREQTRLLEILAAKEPLNPRWQERIANALGLEASLREISGRVDEALSQRARARAMLESLVAKDPANRTWALALMKSVVHEAELLRGRGELEAARSRETMAQAGLAKLLAAESGDRAVQAVLVSAWRLETKLREAEGRTDASEAAAKAVAIGEGLLAAGRANEDVVGSLVQACVLAGQAARQRGDPAEARRRWERAQEVARPRLNASSNWMLLDPAARALVLLGRTDEGREVIARLTKFGYQPLEPWPEAAEVHSLSEKTKP